MIHKEEIVTYISDISGKPITKVESIGIKRGSKMYVIDIDADHAEEELASITVADALTKGRVENTRRSAGRRNRRAEVHAAARAWARGQGMDVGARGSLSSEIVKAYKEAMRVQTEGEYEPENTHEIEQDSERDSDHVSV